MVLLDTYLQDEMSPETATALTEGLFERRGTQATEEDATSLAAMGACFRVFEEWSPGAVQAPTLFLRARDELFGAPALGGSTDLVRSVPGDHFTMLEEHAEHAAQAVHTWLAEAAEEPRPSPVTPKRSDRHV